MAGIRVQGSGIRGQGSGVRGQGSEKQGWSWNDCAPGEGNYLQTAAGVWRERIPKSFRSEMRAEQEHLYGLKARQLALRFGLRIAARVSFRFISSRALVWVVC